MKYRYALVVGAGAFGTSIASVLANNFEKVFLKLRSDDVYQGLLQGENKIYLPNHPLAKNIIPALEWQQVDKESGGKIDLVVSGLPASGIRAFFEENNQRFLNYLKAETPIVSLSKGIDPVSLELADDQFFHFYTDYKEYITFLSGPSFAKEIMSQQITMVSLAGRSKKILTKVANMLETDYFKVLMSYDIKGCLLGGALKNILAIAGGVIEGLGYNYNTRAAMITRGIAEMLRFGKVYNARPETFYGLSGMGDLILTTTGDLSRNKSFGLEIAKGKSPQEILKSKREVVEGYETTLAAHRVSEKYDIRTNIFSSVYSVLYENQEPAQVISKLMRLPTRFEID